MCLYSDCFRKGAPSLCQLQAPAKPAHQLDRLSLAAKGASKLFHLLDLLNLRGHSFLTVVSRILALAFAAHRAWQPETSGTGSSTLL